VLLENLVLWTLIPGVGNVDMRLSVMMVVSGVVMGGHVCVTTEVAARVRAHTAIAVLGTWVRLLVRSNLLEATVVAGRVLVHVERLRSLLVLLRLLVRDRDGNRRLHVRLVLRVDLHTWLLLVHHRNAGVLLRLLVKLRVVRCVRILAT